MFIVNLWGHRCATAILTIRNNQPCRNSPWSSSTLALSQRHVDPLFPERTFGSFYCLKRTSGSASNVPASPGLRMASFNGSESGSCFFLADEIGDPLHEQAVPADALDSALDPCR